MCITIRAQWIDPVVSHEVEKILGAVENLDVWVPETLDMIHETRAIDFMISPYQFDNVSHLLRMNTVQSNLPIILMFFSLMEKSY